MINSISLSEIVFDERPPSIRVKRVIIDYTFENPGRCVSVSAAIAVKVRENTYLYHLEVPYMNGNAFLRTFRDAVLDTYRLMGECHPPHRS